MHIESTAERQSYQQLAEQYGNTVNTATQEIKDAIEKAYHQEVEAYRSAEINARNALITTWLKKTSDTRDLQEDFNTYLKGLNSKISDQNKDATKASEQQSLLNLYTQKFGLLTALYNIEPNDRVKRQIMGFVLLQKEHFSFTPSEQYRPSHNQLKPQQTAQSLDLTSQRPGQGNAPFTVSINSPKTIHHTTSVEPPSQQALRYFYGNRNPITNTEPPINTIMLYTGKVHIGTNTCGLFTPSFHTDDVAQIRATYPLNIIKELCPNWYELQEVLIDTYTLDQLYKQIQIEKTTTDAITDTLRAKTKALTDALIPHLSQLQLLGFTSPYPQPIESARITLQTLKAAFTVHLPNSAMTDDNSSQNVGVMVSEITDLISALATAQTQTQCTGIFKNPTRRKTHGFARSIYDLLQLCLTATDKNFPDKVDDRLFEGLATNNTYLDPSHMRRLREIIIHRLTSNSLSAQKSGQAKNESQHVFVELYKHSQGLFSKLSADEESKLDESKRQIFNKRLERLANSARNT